jgi:DNA-binding Xre family transcriptional regulator
MLKFNLKRVLKIKGVTNPSMYLFKAGFKRQIAHRIATDKFKNLTPEQIELLCFNLECTPNDLFEFTPTNTKYDYTAHPLSALKRETEPPDLRNITLGIPIDKMDEFNSMVSKAKEEVLKK